MNSWTHARAMPNDDEERLAAAWDIFDEDNLKAAVVDPEERSYVLPAVDVEPTPKRPLTHNEKLCQNLKKRGVDPAKIRIGSSRGSVFLQRPGSISSNQCSPSRRERSSRPW